MAPFLSLETVEIYQRVFEGLPGSRPESWVPIRLKEDAYFLAVYDLNQSAGASLSEIKSTVDAKEARTLLSSLPEQVQGTTRVYLRAPNGAESPIEQHLEQTLQLKLDSSKPETRFEAFASQWRSGIGAKRFRLETYHFGPPEHWSIRSTKLEGARGARVFLAELTRLKMDMCIMDASRDRTVVNITVQPSVSTWWNPGPRDPKHSLVERWERESKWLIHFCECLLRDDDLHGAIAQGTTPEFSKQLLLFRCYSSVMSGLSNSLNTLDRKYAKGREMMMDLRRSENRPSIVETISADADIYAKLSHATTTLTGYAATLVDLSEAQAEGLPKEKTLKCMVVELQCECSHAKTVVSRLSSRLDHRLKFIELSRNMHEASRTWLLSVLASIFLPVSIATGLLSMQTRLADLDALLYDFCGVIVFVGTALLLVFALMKDLLPYKEKLKTMSTAYRGGRRLSNFITSILRGMAVLSWGLLVASFAVGMFKNIDLGWKILGFGAAAVVGMLLVYTASRVVVHGFNFSPPPISSYEDATDAHLA